MDVRKAHSTGSATSMRDNFRRALLAGTALVGIGVVAVVAGSLAVSPAVAFGGGKGGAGGTGATGTAGAGGAGGVAPSTAPVAGGNGTLASGGGGGGGGISGANAGVGAAGGTSVGGLNNGGAGGNGGTPGITGLSINTTNTTPLAGGNGTDGTDGTQLGGGGGGGGGGNGINVNTVGGIGVMITNSSTITGGNGGKGGNSPSGVGGNGGDGGVGISISEDNVTVNNSGIISGGAGGAAGTGGAGNGTAGTARNGILVGGSATLTNVTIINSGSINGVAGQSAAIGIASNSTVNLTLDPGSQPLNNGGISVGGTLNFVQANNAIVNVGGPINDNAGSAITTVGTVTVSTTGTSVIIFGGNDTYSGGTTIKANSTLGVGSNTALGTGALTMTDGSQLRATNNNLVIGNAVTLGGTDTINTQANNFTLGGVISGAGNLTKTGGGTLNLTNAGNTFTGNVNVNGGAFGLTSDGALGNAANVLNLAQGTQLTTGTTFTINHAVTVTGIDPVINVTAGTLTIAGNITGAGDVEKDGNGSLVLSGNNSYTLGTVVINGTIQAGSATAFGTGPMTVGTAGTVTSATLDLGGFSTSVAGLSGTVKGIITNSGGTNATLTNTGPSGVYAGLIQDGATNKTALTQNAAGQTLTLTGANTYTGGTTIQAGTVSIGNVAALGTGQITFTGNGALESIVTGTVANAATVNSGVSATIGATAGNALTLTGALADNGGAGTTLHFGSATDTGTVTLTPSAVTGSPAGGIAVDGGTLKLGNANAATIVGSLLGGTNVGTGATSATLDLNGISTQVQKLTGNANGIITNSGAADATVTNVGPSSTFAGVIQDGATNKLSLTQNQPGQTLTLTGTNTYTGDTTIQVGTLALSGAGSIANSARVNITNSGGTFDISNTTAGATIKSLDGVTNSSVNLGTQTLTLSAAAGTFNGVISGSGGLTETGGSETLIGTNTYTGDTTIGAATLKLTGSGSIATSARVNITDAAGVFDLSGTSTGASIKSLDGVANSSVALGAKTLTLSNASGTFSGVIGGAGGGLTLSAGTETLLGSNTYTGVTTINGGTLQFGNGGTTGGVAGNIVVNSPGILAVNHSNTLTYGGIVSGNGTVNQNGSGNLTVTGTNTNALNFTGTVNVNAGILQVDGKLGDVVGNTAVVNVNSGATLQGTGTIAGNVFQKAGGILAPGDSPGTLTILGNLVQNGASITNFQLGGAGSSGVVGGGVNDLVNVGGNLTIAGTYNVTGGESGYYRLFNYGGTLTNNGPTLNTGFGTATLLTNIAGQVNLSLSNGGQLVQYWDGTDMTGNGVVDGGTSTWNASNTNWTTPTGFGINDQWRSQVGVFMGTAGTVTVSGTQAFQGLQFATTGYSVTGGTLNMLGNNVAGGNANASFIKVDPGLTATIGSVLAGAGIGLDKMGTGTLILTGTNTYTGDTTILAGTLALTGTGSIATSARVNITNAAGVFDISGTTAGATIKSLDGVANSTVALGGKTLTLSAAAGTFNGVIADGGLSGGVGGGLTLTGGTEILTGTNTYTGDTTIGAGTLKLTGTGSIATSARVNITNAAGVFDISGMSAGASIKSLDGVANSSVALGGQTLTLTAAAGTFNGVVSGSGGALVLTGGTETLTGTNTYSGGTTVQAGTLSIGNMGALGSGGVTLSGGTLRSTVSGTLANAITFASGTTSTLSAATGTTLKTTGQLLAFGTISQFGSATDTGTIQLGSFPNVGASTNGAIAVNGGTLQALDNGLSFITVTATSTTVAGGATLDFNDQQARVLNLQATAANAIVNTGASTATDLQVQQGSFAGVIQGAGSLHVTPIVGAGTLTLSGINTYTGATTIDGTKTLALTGSGSIATSSGVNIAAATGIFDISGTTTGATIKSLSGVANTSVVLGTKTLTLSAAAGTFNGVFTGSGGLTLAGGTEILKGANTAALNFTGTVNVNVGTLQVDGKLGDVVGNNATVNVNNGGVLQGTGTIAGNVFQNAGGVLAPGDSPGTLTILGNLVQSGGSFTNFQLGGAGSSGVVGSGVNDLVNVGGNLTIAGIYNVTGGESGYYRLFNYGGTLTNNGPTLNTGFGTATLLTNIVGQVNLSLSNGGQLVQYWDGTDMIGNGVVDGGTSTWNASNTNWTMPVGFGVNDQWRSQVGVFMGTAGTVTVSGTQSFQGLQFSTTGYNLTGGTLNMLGNNVAGGNANASFIKVDPGLTATIGSVLAGTGIGLDKMGTGTLILTGTNTYTGDTTILAGTLALTGTGSIAQLNRVNITNAAGVFDISGTTSGATIKSLDGIANSTVALGGKTLTLSAAAGTFNGVIADGGLSGGTGGGLTLTGGTETLTGLNTYTGLTTVNGGTLNITGQIVGGLLNNSTVNAQGVVNGTVANAITNNGTFNVTGNLGSNTTFGNSLNANLNVNVGTYTIAGLLTNSGMITVKNGATLTDTAGGIKNNAGATITVNQGGTVNDVLNNSGIVINSGAYNADVNNTGAVASITNTATGVWTGNLLSNTGGALVTNQGSWKGDGNNASGTVDNQGTWTTTAAGFTNAGTFKNSTAGSLLDATLGGFTNTGIAQAQGTIKGVVQNNGAGSFTLTGGPLALNNTFTNNGTATFATGANALTGVTTFTNNSTSATAVNVGAGGSITATTAINNTAGTFTNNGTLSAPLVSNTGGTMTTIGTINASTSITNSAIMNAQGTFNTPLFTNTGTFALTGALGGPITQFTNNDPGTVNIGAFALSGVGTFTNNSTSANAVRVAGGGSITAGTAINNTAGTFTNNGTLTAPRVSNSGGTMTTTGTINASTSITNAAIMNAQGTFNTPLFTNTGTFALTGALGGPITQFTNNDPGTINIGAFALSGVGTFTNNSTSANAVKVAGGGSITAATAINNTAGTFTNNGTLTAPVVSNTGGTMTTTGTINASTSITNSAIMNAQGTFNTPLFTNMGTFALTGALGGPITQFTNNNPGTVNIGAFALSGVGTFTNNSTSANAVRVAGGGSITAGTAINNTAGTFTNAGTLAAPVVNNSGTGILNSTGIINATLTNSATVNASGQINGIVNNTGTMSVTGTLTGNGSAYNNNAAGLLTVGGNSYTGIGAFTNATTGLVSIGTSTVNGTLGVASLTNNGTTANAMFPGAITMQNGLTGDMINVTNAFVSGPGSTLAFDANLGLNTNTADRITAATTSGTSTVSIQNTGAKIFFSTPIVLISSGNGGGTFTAANDAQTQAALAPNGIVNYSFGKIPGTNNFGIFSSLNVGAVESIASSVSSAVASLNTSFFQNASAFIGSPASPEPNKWFGGLWVRPSEGSNTLSSSSVANDINNTSSSSKVALSFHGVQLGADGGLFNINNSGMNTHFGVTGGWVNADARSQTAPGANTSFDVPFYGVYGALTGNGLLVDAQIRHDSLNMRVTNPTAVLNGVPLKGSATTFSTSGAYQIYLGNYFVEPSVAYSYSRVRVDTLALGAAAGGGIGSVGNLQFGSLSSSLGRVGLRAGTTVALEKIVMQPFVAFSVWHEFAGNTVTTFVPTGGAQNVTVLGSRIGTFEQVSVGVAAQVADTNMLGFVRADARVGSSLNGWALTGGLRYQFQ